MKEARAADEIFADVSKLMRRSEYLKAFDLARHGVETYPDHVELRHRGVLALARMGASAHARALYEEWRLQEITGDEDVLALWARLKKDEARLLSGQARLEAFAEAARAYTQSYEAGGGGYFPAINVASLNLMADLPDAAVVWARRAETLAAGGEDYYSLATLAEAALILDRPADARTLLRQAALAAKGDYAAMSTTRQQLGEIIALKGLDADLLAPLAVPPVAHFCGHMVTAPGGRMPASEVDAVRERIRGAVAESGAAFAFGSLAGGSDIIIAEAIIEAGGELNVVLPFDREEFAEVSVRPSGDGWVERFDACLEAARNIHYVTEDAYLEDNELFSYATHLAMGLARLRAQMLGAEMVQIAVWDGAPADPTAAAGTVFDVARGWRLGLRQFVVPSKEGVTLDLDSIANARSAGGGKRQRRTMIFGDLKGFSKLTDEQLPIYVDTVLGTCAKVFDDHAEHLKFRNTWGDGLFLVFDDLAAAARCAFALQEALSGIDHAAVGLPDTLGLRLGMHYGPVYEKRDPVLDRANYFGFHVSRAARVEPITPEGEVYVTESAAAAMAVDAAEEFRCDYVGRVPLAKGYGDFPMYALTRR